jgi:hypothetical protein
MSYKIREINPILEFSSLPGSLKHSIQYSFGKKFQFGYFSMNLVVFQSLFSTIKFALLRLREIKFEKSR